MEQIFHREEYPYSTLQAFGLSRAMIQDLPEEVLDTISQGGRSPLLPVSIATRQGEIHARAKFRLIETDSGTGVLFMPRLRQAPLQDFTPAQQQSLQGGRPIQATVTPKGESRQNVKAFVQLDADTGSVFYVPSPIIARNLRATAQEFGLTPEQLRELSTGGLVTVMQEDTPVTLGIDLNHETGIRIQPGEALYWQQTASRPMPPYSFGGSGCWVNRQGELTYVREQDFTPDILQELERRLHPARAPRQETHAPAPERAPQEHVVTPGQPSQITL